MVVGMVGLSRERTLGKTGNWFETRVPKKHDARGRAAIEIGRSDRKVHRMFRLDCPVTLDLDP